MNRKCFKMTEKGRDEVVTYLKNQKIIYASWEQRVKIFVGPHPEDEYVIFDFEKKTVEVKTYIDSTVVENVDHIELGWKRKNFSLRLFNDHTDLFSFIFYKVKRV